MKKIEKVALITLAVEIIVIVLCFALNFLKSPSCMKLERITKSVSSGYIHPEYEQEAADYLKDMKKSFESKFMENPYIEKLKRRIRRPAAGNLTKFGISLLSMYQLNKKKTEYLTIVEHLIREMDTRIGDLLNKQFSVPWGDNWYHYSVSFPRMLAMYEYIGKNNAIKDICRRRILQITTDFTHSLGWERFSINIVYIAIPRLLTNYMFDRERYDSELKSRLFSKVDKEMNTYFNPDNVVFDGMYQDYSFISHNDIPTFSYISTLGEFYINTYKALGLKSDISVSIMKMFDKLLHPKMDFIGYGLFGRDPRITCTGILKSFWPNYKRNKNYDVNIFPFIGLGVFKSEDFVFSVRVQRDKIAAYEFDQWYNKFALGWIQMRKLYHKDVDYTKYKSIMEWEQLKTQPGVISFAEDKYNSFEAFKDEKNSNTYTRPASCENIKSFIGHLKNHNNRKLLYWSNKYEFSAFYGPNVEIRENGVCTDNGLVMRHEINNNSGKELKLIMKDKDIGEKMKFKSLAAHSGTEISIPSGGAPVIVNWSQLFNENIEPTTVDWDKANNSMSFTFEGDSYSIEQYEKYHIVKCKGKVILAGNSSSLRKNRFTHENESKNETIYFQRDPETLMHLPEQR